jgi:hypothetical protein
LDEVNGSLKLASPYVAPPGLLGSLHNTSGLRHWLNYAAPPGLWLIFGRKVGNKLVVEGEEFHGHQDDPIKRLGNGHGKVPD